MAADADGASLAGVDGATEGATDGATEGATDGAVLGAVEGDEPVQAARMMAVVAPRAISRRDSCNALLLHRSRTPLGCGPGQGRRVREIRPTRGINIAREGSGGARVHGT